MGAQRAEGSRAGVRRFIEAHVGVEEEESLLCDSDSRRNGEVVERLVVEAQLVCDEHRQVKWVSLNAGISVLNILVLVVTRIWPSGPGAGGLELVLWTLIIAYRGLLSLIVCLL